MMRAIGWRERFQLARRKRNLSGKDQLLLSALGVFNAKEDQDRTAISALIRKRCDLADEMTEIGVWLAQRARPIVVAPTGSGKGLPPGSLPLSCSSREVC